MATEEVTKPPSLPPYSEMIFAAIAASNDSNGSDKSAISSYIESSYENLPADHSTLLSNHLNTMKESGDLTMVNNNYMRPNPEAPPKRGRGRPPKPKLPEAPGTVPGPARPRGRPAKPKDPLAVASSGSWKPRGRGRPPKKARAAVEAVATTSGSPRPRGRPPKVKNSFADMGSD